jgi:DNA invertase Pin-like site-specific DNA recombinase
MGMVGYARVSTREQDPAAQEWELKAAGAERVFVDHGESSRVADRPQWLACKDYLRACDTLVVRALDRLAGTTTLAIQTITELGDRGINIKSLTEPDKEAFQVGADTRTCSDQLRHRRPRSRHIPVCDEGFRIRCPGTLAGST